MRLMMIGSILALVALASPMRADDCNKFSSDVALFQSEQDDFLRELKRVGDLKPEPTQDVALCRALRMYAEDAPYFLIADTNHPSCFQDAQQAKTFVGYVHEIYINVGTLVGGYCSDEELKRPVHSKVLGAQ
jgi:hypothetical protein